LSIIEAGDFIINNLEFIIDNFGSIIGKRQFIIGPLESIITSGLIFSKAGCCAHFFVHVPCESQNKKAGDQCSLRLNHIGQVRAAQTLLRSGLHTFSSFDFFDNPLANLMGGQ
jgi:hypothetical protein